MPASPSLPADLDAARLSPDHPGRPPAWRWLSAEPAARKWARARPDDPMLRLAVEFRRDVAAAERAPARDPALRRVAARRPAFFEACRVYTNPDRTRRHLVEAYLLAGVTPIEAAARCGLSANAGIVFADVFDDVGDRLDMTAFIMTEAIGPARPGSSEAELGRAWKLAAYRKGVAVLESLLCEDFTGRTAADPADAGRACDDLTRGALRARALLAATGHDPTRDARPLLAAHAKEQAAADKPGAVSAESQKAYSMVQALGVAARYGGPAKPPTGLPAAELRASEELARAVGGVPTGNFVDPDTVAFPAPPASDRPA